MLWLGFSLDFYIKKWNEENLNIFFRYVDVLNCRNWNWLRLWLSLHSIISRIIWKIGKFWALNWIYLKRVEWRGVSDFFWFCWPEFDQLRMLFEKYQGWGFRVIQKWLFRPIFTQEHSQGEGLKRSKKNYIKTFLIVIFFLNFVIKVINTMTTRSVW